MDNSVNELAAVEQAVADSKEKLARELADLQLVMLGGGLGETILV
jgi:hypothetical protein